MTEQEQPKKEEQPEQPRMTIQQIKVDVCNRLTAIFARELMQQRLLRMCGGDESRLARLLTSFIGVLMQDEGSGDPKKFYVQCSISSLTQCFLESVNMQLPFDSRKLVSLVIYDWEVELDISYKGFINALCRHYDNAYVDAKIIMEGDEFECEDTPGFVTFRHKPVDPFANVDKDLKGVRGAYCYFTYTLKNGEKIARLVRIPIDAILVIRSKAKTKKVWDEFTSEQVLKTIIRRAAKLPFAAIDLEVDIEEQDNRHYDLEKPASQAKLQDLMAAQREVVEGKKEEKKNDNAADLQSKDAGVAKGDAPASDNVISSGAGTEGAGAGEAASPGEGGAKASSEAGETRADDQQPGAGSAAVDDDEPAKPKISDADFEEVAPDSAQPLDSSGDTAATNAGWDGRTVYLGDGKSTVKEFENSDAALKYVMAVMEKRNRKVSRKEIIEGNTLLVAALIRDGRGDAIQSLHDLADKGA